MLIPAAFIHLAPLQGTDDQAHLIGSIGVSGKTKWDVLDGVIRRLFKVNAAIALKLMVS